MGSDWGDFWRRILRLSWFGHQSLFDLIPTFVVPCTTGHLPAFSSVFASMFPSDRVPVFFELFVWNHLDQSASSAFWKRPKPVTARTMPPPEPGVKMRPGRAAHRAMPRAWGRG